MTSMLEKIARAIAEEDGKRFANHTLYDHNPELFALLARAALLAMREPDEVCVDAGKGDSPYVDRGDVSDIFTAMIDAILSQPSTPTDVTPA